MNDRERRIRAHELRMQILGHLRASGGGDTARGTAQALKLPLAQVHHHIRELAAAGYATRAT